MRPERHITPALSAQADVDDADDDYDDVLRSIGGLPPQQRFPLWIVVTALIAVLAFAVTFAF